MLKELIANFDGQPGLSKCFSESAISMLLSGIPALKELGARGEFLINREVISQYTRYSFFCRLAEIELISPESKAAIQGYIKSRAGFDSTMPINAQTEEFARTWDMTHRLLAEGLQSVNEDKWVE